MNAVIQVVALGQVVTSLDNPANIAGYAVGVALGVYVGVGVGGRLTAEPVEHRVVVPGNGTALAGQLRARGWPATMQPAVGLDGPATALFSVSGAGATGEVERELNRLAPDGFRTTSRLHTATRTPLPPGFIQLTDGASTRRAGPKPATRNSFTQGRTS